MIYWSIPRLERTAAENGVIEAHWSVTILEKVNEEVLSSSLYGVKTFTPEPDSPEFIPFEDLTQSVILEWCFTEQEQALLEQEVSAQLEKYKTQEIVTGLPPW